MGMARLIDADALLDYFRNEHHESEVIEAVKDAPTIDAVPVVRCKDCKHCTPDENIVGGYGDCFYKDDIHSIVNADDFCSYGERKDNG